MSREYIAKSLKRLREAVGLTADEVGAKIGKSGKTVNAWENNRGQPDAEMLMVLCDLYKVDNILAEFSEEDAKQTKLVLSEHETDVMLSYRKQPISVQAAIDKMLDVAPAPEIQITAEPKEYARTAAYGGGTKNIPRPKKSGEELNKMVEEAEQNNILAEIRANKAKNKKS